MRDSLIPHSPPNAQLTAESFGRPEIEVHPLDRPLAAVRRYKWLIVTLTVLASVAGLGATRLISPEYDVRATVWITSETPDAGRRVGPIRSGELLSSGAWIELFRSYRILDEVVRSLALYLDFEQESDRPFFADFRLAERFVPGAYDLRIDKKSKTWALANSAGQVMGRGSAADSVGRNIGFQWVLPASIFEGTGTNSVPFTVSTPRETSIRLLDRVGNRLAPGSNFLWLTYRDTDAKRASRTLNTWVSEYVRVAEELKKRNVVEFANILEEQLRFAEKSTQDAEAAYENFRVGTIILPTEGGPVAAGVPGERDPALTSFFEQKIEYDNLRHDREALEKSIASASAGTAPYEGLLFIPSVAQSPGAEALREAFKHQYQVQARLTVERQSFTDEYPTVKELKGTLDVLQRQTIPRLANQLLAQLRERESDYQRRIQAASSELRQIPPRTIEERRLHRAVVVSEGLYTTLKARHAEARLAEASATADVRVLDTAIAPLTPTQNTAPRIVLMAVLGGLGAAVGLALLLDRFDRRIRYSDQASTDLGLVVAGAVPRIPKAGINAGSPEQVVQIIEAFRTIRMHVIHTVPEDRFRLAVTSVAPGDGKSLVSANLALSFAEAGMRTVLIDADTRRGALHRMFGGNAANGLTDYLDGGLAESDILQATTYANLTFVSRGRRNSRSPELLTSPRLRRLVDSLSERFDAVLIDTPPLAAGIDGFAISAAAGNVLLVVRMGQTERRLASAKLGVLDRLPVNVVGSVLNGVSLTGEFQYYAYSAGYSVNHGDLDDALAISSSR